MKAKSGFTLIEIMLVILIIGVLIGMLLPAINAATILFKIKDTETRIGTLGQCLEQYKQTFGDYPPSHASTSTTWSYPTLTPSQWTDNSGGLHYLTINLPMSANANDPQAPLGGGLLFYFLMGPNQIGWSATDSSVNSGPGTPAVRVSANWPAQEVLTKIIYTPHPIPSGTSPSDCAMYYFEDGFGSAGFFQGTIQYSLRLSRGMNQNDGRNVPAGGFDSADLDYAFNQTTGSTLVAGPSWQRITLQCTLPYILISAGPDRIFGYVKSTYNSSTGVTTMAPTTTAGATDGTSDDIMNFSHN